MADGRLGQQGISRDAEVTRVLQFSKPVPAGVTAHGSLGGLMNDDHTQYLHLSSARIVTAQHTFSPGSIQAPFALGTNAQGQTVVGLRADELNKSISAGSGLTGGGALTSNRTLAIDWGTPTITTIQPDDSASAGSSANAARSDHKHAIVAAEAGTIQPDDSAAEGTATSFARSDHKHSNIAAAPGANSVNLAASTEGSGTSFARADHTHQLDQSISPTWTGQHIFQGNVITRHIRPELTDTYDLGTEVYWYRQQFVSQINATVFAESTAQLLGGWFIIPKDAGKLGAVGSGDTQVDFGKAMTVGNFVVIKAHDAGGTIKTEYMQIGSLVGGTTYNVTRDLAGAHGTDPAWSDGTPWMLMGTTGDGRIELNAYDTPRIQMVTQGATYNAQSEIVRIGDLNGNWGYTGQTFGMAIGERGAGKVNLTMDATNGFRVFLNATQLAQWDASGNITIGQVAAGQDNVYMTAGGLSIRNNTTERIGMTAAGVLTIKDSGGAAVITLDASAGAEFTKPLTLGSGGGIYQGSGSFASPTTGLKIWNDSSFGRIGGYNSGVLQWYANTDGKMYAGGGNVILDANGISIEASSGFYADRALNLRDSGSSVSHLYAVIGGSNYTRLTTERLSKNSIIEIVASANSGYLSSIAMFAAGDGYTGGSPMTLSLRHSSTENEILLYTYSGNGRIRLDGDAYINGDVYTTAWTDYSSSSTVTGWSSTTVKQIRYKRVGNLVFVQYYISGTSNSAATSFSLPYNSLARINQYARAQNNGTWQAAGLMQIVESTAIANVYVDSAANGWTASGTKEIRGEFLYEIA